MQPCSICGMRGPDPQPIEDLLRYMCERCGTFDIGERAKAIAESEFAKQPDLRFIASHVVRKMQRAGTPPKLTDVNIRRILAEKPPSPFEQVNTLIELVGDRQKFPERIVDLHFAFLAGVLGTGDDLTKHDHTGLQYVTEYAQSCGWIDGRSPMHPHMFGIRLTFAGWTQYERIKHGLATTRTAFMAMKYGDALLDRACAECFKPAVARTGFELRRLDEKQPAGLIDNQLRVAIRASRFLVADLTEGNQGAYWEAGFAEGLGKPVIYTCEKTHFETVRTHFDTNHHVTIKWSAPDFATAANELADTIRNTLPGDAILTDS